MLGFLRKNSSETALRLAESTLFAGLTPGELSTVEGLTHSRSYLAGEVIFDEGEQGQALYVVVTGEVLICHAGELDPPIARLGPGQFFGELALLDDAPRTAQARASLDSELAVLSRSDFERLMDSHARIASRVALQLARNISLRLRDMVQG